MSIINKRDPQQLQTMRPEVKMFANKIIKHAVITVFEASAHIQITLKSNRNLYAINSDQHIKLYLKNQR